MIDYIEGTLKIGHDYECKLCGKKKCGSSHVEQRILFNSAEEFVVALNNCKTPSPFTQPIDWASFAGHGEVYYKCEKCKLIKNK